MRVHGTCAKHGTGKQWVWRKLQLAVDTTTGDVLAHEMAPRASTMTAPHCPRPADADRGDCRSGLRGRGLGFVQQARRLPRVRCDTRDPAAQRGAIRPPRGMKDPPSTRGEAVRRILRIGRTEWNKEAGSHRRSLAETAMFLHKAIIGPNLRSRNLATQKTEAAIGLRCLNQFTGSGMPTSIKIV